jgi:hypothetical protein
VLLCDSNPPSVLRLFTLGENDWGKKHDSESSFFFCRLQQPRVPRCDIDPSIMSLLLGAIEMLDNQVIMILFIIQSL